MNVKKMATSHDAIALEGFLPYRLNVIAEAVSRALAREYGARHGINVAQWRVLATLGQYHTMTARDIGAHSRMHKTKVSRAIAALAERGLVTRRASNGDRREALVSLSARGLAVYRDLVPVARRFEAAILAGLSDEQRRRLDSLLDDLERLAGAAAGKDGP